MGDGWDANWAIQSYEIDWVISPKVNDWESYNEYFWIEPGNL